MRKARQAALELAGREVVITNPDKPFFPQTGHTKLHLVRYYAAVAEGALRGIAGRPIVLKRYVDGAAGEPFFQKRAPEQRPEWIETVELRFPSGRTAREIVVRDAAQLLWRDPFGYRSYERDRWFESGSLQGHSRCSAPHRIEARVLH
jgi:DNA primase